MLFHRPYRVKYYSVISRWGSLRISADNMNVCKHVQTCRNHSTHAARVVLKKIFTVWTPCDAAYVLWPLTGSAHFDTRDFLTILCDIYFVCLGGILRVVSTAIFFHPLKKDRWHCDGAWSCKNSCVNVLIAGLESFGKILTSQVPDTCESAEKLKQLASCSLQRTARCLGFWIGAVLYS